MSFSGTLRNTGRTGLAAVQFRTGTSAIPRRVSNGLFQLNVAPIQDPAAHLKSSIRNNTITNRRLLHSTPARREPAAAAAAAPSPTPTTDNATADVLCSLDPAPKGTGTVATITLSNPRRLNSLNQDLIQKLSSTLRSLAELRDLRCVIVQGAQTTAKSPAFTAGANIYQMASLKCYEEAEAFILGLHGACQAMRDIPVPTIARIDGLCLGGGLELAAACDFRYATRTSTFSMPETKFGIPSVIEARLLANIIGWQRTKEMCFFAKFYSAEEVAGWGLVDKSCKDVEELEETVNEAVGIITSYGAKTMREQKRLYKVWEENDLQTGIEAGVHAYATMFQDGGSEPAHYMKEFTERKR